MNLDELLLNINAVDFDSLVSQASIQTEKDKAFYNDNGYHISFTEDEFKEKFNLNPSCVWYTPSISNNSLYFNLETLAAAPLHLELITAGFYSADSYNRAIAAREAEVKNNDYRGSVITLPDGLRMKYFDLLVEKKGSDIPDLYGLFFSSYLHADYGFGNIKPETLNKILEAKTSKDIKRTEMNLEGFP